MCVLFRYFRIKRTLSSDVYCFKEAIRVLQEVYQLTPIEDIYEYVKDLKANFDPSGIER